MMNAAEQEYNVLCYEQEQAADSGLASDIVGKFSRFAKFDSFLSTRNFAFTKEEIASYFPWAKEMNLTPGRLFDWAKTHPPLCVWNYYYIDLFNRYVDGLLTDEYFFRAHQVMFWLAIFILGVPWGKRLFDASSDKRPVFVEPLCPCSEDIIMRYKRREESIFDGWFSEPFHHSWSHLANYPSVFVNVGTATKAMLEEQEDIMRGCNYYTQRKGHATALASNRKGYSHDTNFPVSPSPMKAKTRKKND